MNFNNSMQDSVVSALQAMLGVIWLPFLAIVLGSAVVLVLGKLFQPRFTRKVLLNKSEIRLFEMLQRAKPDGHHVSCQVSYGEFLACDSKRKFWSINAKRADFVLCDRSFNVVAVIEYQGGGHFGATAQSRGNALGRDRDKRRALAEVGLPMIEVPAKFSQELIDRLVAAALNPVVAAAERNQPDFQRIEPTFRV